MKVLSSLLVITLLSFLAMPAFALEPHQMTCAQVKKAVRASGANGVWMRISFLLFAQVKLPKYGCEEMMSRTDAVVRTLDSSACLAGMYCEPYQPPNTGVPVDAHEAETY